ncbi:vWA domain-containing protein [Granulosicoccus antarcticus]|uniref:VWFA domain-containing protein n=1 Tax=Granulosicoccus antarcticus IMCC3135 TaxID=1192854 RepID=A0A2Z2NWR5_9GAMM|nr:VWA domain-containing protein [Granulosicoccus antarcticus]ASJ75799.1 hypothetical protein IMCC3135_28735 [Granulosicoccus antarcticus IMCC3135]
MLWPCSDSDGGGNTPADDDVVFAGSLMAPEITTGVEKMLDSQLKTQLRIADDCPAIPAGYSPLADASITFVDENGEVLGESFTADECGAFSASAPATATGIVAEAPGFRPLQAETEVFIGEGATGLASTIASTSSYEIGTLQIVDDGTLAFSVTDNESRKAVLGIPASAFSLLLDDTVLTPDSVINASSAINDESATVVLTLDASGSMSETAYTDDNDVDYDRYQLAAIAAHQFLSQKAASDAVALSVFSSNVNFLDQETIDRELPIQNLDGDALSYVLSDDGFTTDAARLRFLVDAYNRRSQLYRGESGDALHPDTPTNIELQYGAYPFAGSTHLYEAVQDALERLALRGNGRPVVVAMTDGQDNGPGDEDDAIQLAKSYGIPIYTVGMDSSSASDELLRVADETGGSYFNVTSTQIGDAFQSIQTGIVFQYLASVPSGSLNTAVTLGVKLDFNGLVAQRTLAPAEDL